LRIQKNKLLLSAVAFTLTSLLAASSFGREELKVMNPHDFKDKKSCARCHTAEVPKLHHDPVTTCVKCHPGNVANHPVYRHPIKVQASRKVLIPEGFPLSVDDDMVCYTCHDYHNTVGMDKMLWIEYKDICIACHVH